MVRKISKIKSAVMALIKTLRQNGISVTQVILFGSYATNTAKTHSDIDLIIISKDLKKYSPLERLEFLSIISWKLPEPMEIIGYTPEEVKGKKGKSIFWDEIQSTGKTIYQEYKEAA